MGCMKQPYTDGEGSGQAHFRPLSSKHDPPHTSDQGSCLPATQAIKPQSP